MPHDHPASPLSHRLAEAGSVAAVANRGRHPERRRVHCKLRSWPPSDSPQRADVMTARRQHCAHRPLRMAWCSNTVHLHTAIAGKPIGARTHPELVFHAVRWRSHTPNRAIATVSRRESAPQPMESATRSIPRNFCEFVVRSTTQESVMASAGGCG